MQTFKPGPGWSSGFKISSRKVQLRKKIAISLTSRRG
nr:MAG TPA: hypothetical protein [Caudoviricetes sp.]